MHAVSFHTVMWPARRAGTNASEIYVCVQGHLMDGKPFSESHQSYLLYSSLMLMPNLKQLAEK